MRPAASRLLLCATSLAGVLAALPAGAAEWELGLGVHLEQSLGYVDYDSATAKGFSGADSVGSAVAAIMPQVTLDSGLQIGGRLRFDAHLGERNAGVEADEASLFVRGSFGELLIGKSDTPGNHMSYGAPMGYGPAVNFGAISAGALASYVPFSNVHNNRLVGDDLIRGTLGSTHVSNMGERTQGRLSYYSPRFSGVQLGVSYAHETPNAVPNRQDFFDVGVNYVNSFGAIDVAASAKWGIADNAADPTASPEYWGAGLRLGYGDFTLGGSWAESAGSSRGVTDGRAFNLGIAYRRGDFGVSASYLKGRNTDDENAGLGAVERLEAVTLTVNHRLIGDPGGAGLPPRPGAAHETTRMRRTKPAVDLYGFVSYAEFTEDMGDGGAGTPGDDVDGMVIGTGIKLSF